jgi:hypothetical protein
MNNHTLIEKLAGLFFIYVFMKFGCKVRHDVIFSHIFIKKNKCLVLSENAFHYT